MGQVEDRREAWREAGELAPFGLLSFADDWRIVHANNQVHAWLAVPSGSLIGQSVDRLMSPASKVFHSTHFFPLLKLHGKADEIYLTLRDAAGRDLPVMASAVRVVKDERALTHCALMTLWRRKEFEAALLAARKEAEAATAAKDEFLAMVSHELRTPLSAITGWVRLLRSGRLDEAMRERAMETIERNARQQSQLIEDLLDVSRIVSGKLRLSLERSDLLPVAAAALNTALPAAQSKGVELLQALDRNAGFVYADPNRMQQVMWNLLSNAIKFTPEGGRVELALSRADRQLRIQVTDTGKGLTPDEIPHLFERFWQSDLVERHRRAGLGLGLSICKHLVELHGGTIRADSAGPGEGSVFTVELPLVDA